MSDVLKRLRSIQNDCAQYVWHNAIMREAADEIERQQKRSRELESGLSRLVNWPDGGNLSGVNNMKAFARKLLESE